MISIVPLAAGSRSLMAWMSSFATAIHLFKRAFASPEGSLIYSSFISIAAWSDVRQAAALISQPYCGPVSKPGYRIREHLQEPVHVYLGVVTAEREPDAGPVSYTHLRAHE